MSAGMLRARGERRQRVTFMELFFDLVYVVAVTQLSQRLLEHLNVHGALQTLLLLLAVWSAWIYTAWITNWFDPDHPTIRLMLLGTMLVSLIMSATLPAAFGERGLLFAGAFVAIQVGRNLFVVAVLGSEPKLRRNFQRILAWLVAGGMIWLVGGLAQGPAREALWIAAVIVDYTGPILGFFTPGLGRSETTEWTITGAHLAERCNLFLIVALGESILVTGATFGRQEFSALALAALAVAFLGSVALWWIYFDRAAEASSEVIATSVDPGRLGRSAYTYFHLPMVAGIIVTAVGDELTIAQPVGPASAVTIVVVLSGPALFLAGHALFKWAVFGHVSVPRVLAIIALAALGPVGLIVAPLTLASAAVLVLAGVAAWDTWTLRSTSPVHPLTTPHHQ